MSENGSSLQIKPKILNSDSDSNDVLHLNGDSSTDNEYVIRSNLIDLSQIRNSSYPIKLSNEIEVQLFEDQKPTVFVKGIESKNNGYYWYGVNGDNSFSIQILNSSCIG